MNTDEIGTFQVASTGESDPIHIMTSGTDKTRVEITTSSGQSIRVLNGGKARFRDASGVTRDLSTTNTFHERVSANPALSLLAECQSSNVQAIDAGTTTLDGITVHQIDMAWAADSTSKFSADELKYSKISFFIDPAQSTVVEVNQDRFAENDSTISFHYRVLYSDYRPEGTRFIPHTITTFVNSKLSDTIVISAYSEPSQINQQQLVLEDVQ
jgi:hypothetical protein